MKIEFNIKISHDTDGHITVTGKDLQKRHLEELIKELQKLLNYYDGQKEGIVTGDIKNLPQNLPYIPENYNPWPGPKEEPEPIEKTKYSLKWLQKLMADPSTSFFLVYRDEITKNSNREKLHRLIKSTASFVGFKDVMDKHFSERNEPISLLAELDSVMYDLAFITSYEDMPLKLKMCFRDNWSFESN
jgi:hypothetical protein